MNKLIVSIIILVIFINSIYAESVEEVLKVKTIIPIIKSKDAIVVCFLKKSEKYGDMKGYLIYVKNINKLTKLVEENYVNLKIGNEYKLILDRINTIPTPLKSNKYSEIMNNENFIKILYHSDDILIIDNLVKIKKGLEYENK